MGVRSEYPEHEKLHRVAEDSQMIGEFLDVGLPEQGIILAEAVKFQGFSEKQLVPTRKSIQQILAAYFDIDLDKIEAEKRAMLDDIRAGL